MFQRKVTVEYVTGEMAVVPCPIKWLDNCAMRNFTNDAVFDDTLPTSDGVLEIGNRVPLDRLSRFYGGLVPAEGIPAKRRRASHQAEVMRSPSGLVWN
jgi:hypothetical protein